MNQELNMTAEENDEWKDKWNDKSLSEKIKIVENDWMTREKEKNSRYVIMYLDS